jgi:hypothetical protein
MNTEIDKELQELSDRLQAEYSTTEVPSARRERAMFVEGAAQRSRPRVRIAIPALATTALLVAAFFVGRATQPQDPLYSVFSAVGLADTTLEEIDALIEDADSGLDRAELLAENNDVRAVGLASDALMDLGHAQALLDEVSSTDDSDHQKAIDRLRARAMSLILSATEREDSSGPGSGDDSDENSGPGSGDDSDDNSGPGSGDDSEDSDNSGPGSGGDDSDDNSGPGSGDDSDDSDNSGPGSGGDDSDDSSGSGSGGDDSDNSGPGSANSGSGSGGDDLDLDDLEEKDD